MFGTDISMELVIQYGLQAGSALLILAIGAFLAKSAGQYTHRSLAKIEMEIPVRLLLVRIVKGLIFLFTVLVVLQQFGIQIFPLIAGLGVAGVGIGLALQGVFLNLFAGLSIIFTKPFRVGEFIDILGEHGEVQAIDIFSTKLLHLDRSIVVIPNRKIIGEILHNYGKIRQLDLLVGVAYATDLTHALNAVRRIVTANPRVIQDPPGERDQSPGRFVYQHIRQALGGDSGLCARPSRVISGHCGGIPNRPHSNPLSTEGGPDAQGGVVLKRPNSRNIRINMTP